MIGDGVAHGALCRCRTRHGRSDQLQKLRQAPLRLPQPQDPRSRALADLLHESPSARLDDLASLCGASRRTLERLFIAETGMPIARWRRQLRLVQALRLLGAAPGNRGCTPRRIQHSKRVYRNVPHRARRDPGTVLWMTKPRCAVVVCMTTPLCSESAAVLACCFSVGQPPRTISHDAGRIFRQLVLSFERSPFRW